MQNNDILKRPLLTEKTESLPDKIKGGKERVAFIVDKRANKIQIAEAIRNVYGVEVEAVNIINYKGKAKVKYTKTGIIEGRTNVYKKAIITLRAGEVIDLFESI
ncbi:MAG: 50S ribosomal protein L23 [Microscillaceae bacterium]|jgi:large subunit ribosomal protein L23|nr:50S ribosomal protein L23 [Microscillaceae bacterium]